MRHGDFEIVTHGGMRFGHQLAHPFQVTFRQRGGGFYGTGIFGQYMAHALRDNRVQLVGDLVKFIK